MTKYIGYKKDGFIDKSQGFFSDYHFNNLTDEEAINLFKREGFETVIIEKDAFDQIFKETTDEKKSRIKNQLISVRKNYLQSTDWYICREIDQPNCHPQEIKNKRIQARQEINDIQNALTLTALNQFSVEFN